MRELVQSSYSQAPDLSRASFSPSRFRRQVDSLVKEAARILHPQQVLVERECRLSSSSGSVALLSGCLIDARAVRSIMLRLELMLDYQPAHFDALVSKVREQGMLPSRCAQAAEAFGLLYRHEALPQTPVRDTVRRFLRALGVRLAPPIYRGAYYSMPPEVKHVILSAVARGAQGWSLVCPEAPRLNG
jgi:hypothetical protein